MKSDVHSVILPLEIRPIRLRSTPLPWMAALLLGLIIGIVVRHEITHQSATLDVEARISKGAIFRVYYNNQWTEPQLAAIRPNQWTHYHFTVPSHLIALRFDPSEEAHAQAQIRSIVIKGHGAGHSQSIDPLQLKEWIGDIQVQVQPNTQSALLTTVAPSGYLMNVENVDVSDRIRVLENFRLDARTLFWCLLASGAMLLLAGIRRNEIVTALFVSALIMCAAFIARITALWLLKGGGPLPPVIRTVGAAAYTGFSKSTELRSVNLSICMAGILVAVVGVFWRWRRHEPLLIRFPVGESKRVRLLFFVGILAVCALFALPAATSYLTAALTARHPTDFDSQNIYTWEFLVRFGKLPWRDFWFPYSGFYNRLLPLYPQILYEFLHQVLLLGVLLWCSLKIFHNRIGMAVGSCVLFLLLQSAQVFLPNSSPRYFLSLSIVLLAAVAVQELSFRYYVLLGVWCGYTISQELSQIMYALPGTALLVVLSLAGAVSGKERIRIVQRAMIGAGVGGGSLLLYVAALYHNSQLTGWWAFVMSLNDQADYGGSPARVRDWVSLSGGLDSGLFVVTLVLVVGGIAHLVWPVEPRDIYSVLPLSIGLLSCMLLQKQVIRSGIETQFIAIPIFGVGLLLYQRAHSAFRVRQAMWLAFSMGILFSCFILEASVWEARILPWFKQVQSFPSNLAALFGRGDWTRAHEAYFAPASFDFGDTTGAQLRDRLRTIAPTNRDETVYVLGNNPLLYVFLEKPVPFYTNIYNESPIDAQRTTLRWLERNRPKYVFWDADAKDFDGVPNPVRIPIVFTHIIEHYRPETVEGKYQVLRRIEPNEELALAYWSSMLGPSINLGYVPAAASSEEVSVGSENASVLIVHASSPRDAYRVSIPLKVGKHKYTLSFSERANCDTYRVRLDRVPLIEAERASGAEVHISGPIDSGVRASIRALPVRTEDLY